MSSKLIHPVISTSGLRDLMKNTDEFLSSSRLIDSSCGHQEKNGYQKYATGSCIHETWHLKLDNVSKVSY